MGRFSIRCLFRLATPVVLATLVLPAQVEAAEPKLTITHLSGPIYLVEDEHYAKTNSLFYVGPAAVTVVGASYTPATASLLAAQIKTFTDLPIREIIDTSPDAEWSGGNSYWTSIGARVMAADVTCDALKKDWSAKVAAVQRNFPGYPSLALSPPGQCYRGDFETQDGHIRVFYLGPSHTPADVFVYFPSEKVLDAGSILKEQLGNLANADVREYPVTLHKLQALHLNIRTVIAGHWSAKHGPDLIDKYLDMLKRSGQPAK